MPDGHFSRLDYAWTMPRRGSFLEYQVVIQAHPT
jgi:hypothetical protein